MIDEDDDSPEPVDLQPAEGIGNAADPVAMLVAAEKRQEQAAAGDAFWRGVLSTPEGRREIWGILESASTFTERFACGPNGAPQPEATWFKAGEQSFGLRLYLKLQFIGREAVWKMHDECDSRYAKPIKRRRRKPD
jgi:hypothetical protein